MPGKADLYINGRIYSGWKSVQVVRDIEAIAGGFSLGFTDAWSEAGALVRWGINPGDECRLLLEGQPVISGYVDRVEQTITATSRELSCAGRDNTADLIDCSAPVEPTQFKNMTLLDLCNTLAAKFGITFIPATLDFTPFEVWAVNHGETVFECIERAARSRGALLLPNKLGGVNITSPGIIRATDALIEGRNILAGSVTADVSGRFSEYTVKGQSRADDRAVSFVTNDYQGKARDEGVKRYRPLIRVTEGSTSRDFVETRAQWEATVREARSFTVRIVVQGWTNSIGALWDVNEVVLLQAPKLGGSGQLLITRVTFSLTPDGTFTELELRSPDAYVAEGTLPTKNKVVKKKKQKDQVFSGWVF